METPQERGWKHSAHEAPYAPGCFRLRLAAARTQSRTSTTSLGAFIRSFNLSPGSCLVSCNGTQISPGQVPAPPTIGPVPLGGLGGLG